MELKIDIKERELWASKDNSTCLQKALPEEPVFVLLARDATSAKTVVHWIGDNLHRNENELRDAFECAMAMKSYRERIKKA